MNVGYIGLGSMGGALARRLVGGVHQLTVWDINGAATAAFKELGITVATTAAELARQCDVVLLCLPRSSDVRQLVFGPAGLAEGLSAGKLVIDQTSGVPGETRVIAAELAAQGVAMIDAPVSGGVAGAEAGTISIMASGADEDYQKALPVLIAISPNVFRCGRTVGDGQAMKLVNNLLSAGCRLAALEVAAMGRKLGLSLTAITDSLNKGSGGNRTSKTLLQSLASGKPPDSKFAMALMLKDMNQAIQLGMDCGVPTTLTNIVRGLLQIGINTMGPTAQYDKIIDLIESMAGTRILDPAGIPSERAVGTNLGEAKELRVGYVGLGTMGGALVRRMMLSRKLHRVFDASAVTMRVFESEGATIAIDLPSLARDCDVIMVCLPTSAIVREVIFGKGGLAEGLGPGKVIVDQSTGDPEITRRIAADLDNLGVSFVDAPVAGGPRGAVAGTIAIMCGGPIEAFTKVRPLFESVSPNIVYCGPTGNGHIAKLISNALSACNCLLTYEAASIAVKYGLKLDDVAIVINKSTGWSKASERILPALSSGKATAAFQMQLFVKDLRLAGRLSIECGAPILISRTVCSLYEAGAHKLGGTSNIDDIAQMYEAMGGIQFSGA
jgi:3-hydroxyisobutyrate dehydrogenase